jgi:phospholipid-binding lipoprotein MlaA
MWENGYRLRAVVTLRVLAFAVFLFVGASSSPAREAAAAPSSGSTASGAEWLDDAEDEEASVDPWEPFNRKMFTFNSRLDDYALRPLATGYAKIVPLGARRSIGRFFYNIRSPKRFANNILQGKPVRGGVVVLRFIVNSTLGVGGLFDPAKRWFGLEKRDEDFGQTLGVYGVPPGPYLVVPVFGPATVRDAIGWVGDIALDPLTYLVSGTFVIVAQAAGEFSNRVNYRSLTLDLFEDVDRFTLEPYVAVQDFYLQKREHDVQE